MIKSLYLKDALGFEKVELEFNKGLILFSGPSGSGKSVLMNTILSLFGYKDSNSKLSLISLINPLETEKYILDDEIIIKSVKKDKNRFFINDQLISKKSLKELFENQITYLNIRKNTEFDNENLLEILDLISQKNSKEFKKIKDNFQTNFKKLEELLKELKSIEDDEKRVNELKEFAKFEIEKIEKINPKIGEYEDCLNIKRELSKKEKISKSIIESSAIFDFQNSVNQTLNLLDINSSFFDDSMNELREHIESAKDRLNELEDVDIESILTRLESLSYLKNRFGSIEDSLKYLDDKKSELHRYNNIFEDKKELKNNINTTKNIVTNQAQIIREFRIKAIKTIEPKIEKYLNSMNLKEIEFKIDDSQININGFDSISVYLNGTILDNLSAGEFNRLRLSLLASKSDFINKNGVLLLDEIDSNLSGQESDSVAQVLKVLSKNYQIFAISHQPQLTSSATQHILVDKIDGKSFAKELNPTERIEEIARIISGKTITKEAIEFSKKLLKK